MMLKSSTLATMPQELPFREIVLHSIIGMASLLPLGSASNRDLLLLLG